MDVKRTIDSANSFWFATARNMEQRRINPTQFQMLLVPGVVCMAFSIELGIKAILMRSEPTPKTHNIANLFSRLTADIQNELLAACGGDRTQFNASIAKVANVFEEWRYVYELPTIQLDMSFLSKLADSVHTILGKQAP